MTDIQTALDGKKLKLYKYDASASAYVFICLAHSKGVTRSNSFESYMALDCDSPASPPVTKRHKTGSDWSMPFSGVMDAARFALLRAGADESASSQWRIVVDVPLADGGGQWDGAAWIENLEISSQNLGTVRFTANLVADGALPWTDATS